MISSARRIAGTALVQPGTPANHVRHCVGSRTPVAVLRSKTWIAPLEKAAA
jgi:hypothetical protein